jgi:hypothetical protein
MADSWARCRTVLALAATLGAAHAAAQQAQTPPAAPETPPERAAEPPRPPEGNWIINLPSADVPRAGTLSLLFTHRFADAVEDSDFHNLFSFDSGADIGIALAYAPLKNLEVSLDRSSNLDVYELAAKYRLLAGGPFSLALRAGSDRRTASGLDEIPGYSRRGYFAQGIFAFSFGSRARITAVPTYVSESSGQVGTSPQLAYEDVFNVPVALSIALGRSVNVQAELVPSRSRYDSPGVGWVMAIEKTVLRHRFAFTVGNLRETTVDQYVAPNFAGLPPEDYYLGFNLVRQWKLK